MTTALEWGEGSASCPGLFLSPEKTRYPSYKRLVGPQGRSEQVRKISPPPGFDPQTIQPVASRYTVYPTRKFLKNHDVGQNDECVFCCILPCFKRFLIDIPLAIFKYLCPKHVATLLNKQSCAGWTIYKFGTEVRVCGSVHFQSLK
jgi:hypothetical protein